MDPMTIGLLAGLAKSVLVDKPQEDRDRQLAAATQRLSPWTHLQANPIQKANPFGNMLQFGATGAMVGQNEKTADLMNERTSLENQYLKNLNAASGGNGSGWQGMGGGQQPSMLGVNSQGLGDPSLMPRNY